MTLSDDAFRYSVWAAAAAAGVLLALADRNFIGRPLFGILLVLVAVGGAIGMNVSPFSFGGTSYYMESLIAMAGALLALAGYVVARAAAFVTLRRSGGGK